MAETLFIPLPLSLFIFLFVCCQTSLCIYVCVCIFRRLLFIFISVTAVLMVCLEMEETLKSSITELSHFSNTLPTIHIQRIFNLNKYFFLKQSQSFKVIFNFTEKRKLRKIFYLLLALHTHTLYMYILWQAKGFCISLMERTPLVCTTVYVYIFKPVNIFCWYFVVSWLFNIHIHKFPFLGWRHWKTSCYFMESLPLFSENNEDTRLPTSLSHQKTREVTQT